MATRYEGMPPYLDQQGADAAVVVPTRSRRLPGMRMVRYPVGRGLRASPFVTALFLLVWGVAACNVLLSPGAGFTALDLLGPALLVLGVAQTGRLFALWRRSRRGVSLLVGPGGLTVDGLRIPWSAIESVVTFRTRLEPYDVLVSDQPPWSWLAVRVSDFDNVLGLSPVRAGLANLTRRRLVVLVEASEVEDPWALRDALRHLVEHPEARASLTTEDGVRLLTHGPA